MTEFINHNILLLGEHYTHNWAFVLDIGNTKDNYEDLFKWTVVIRNLLPYSKIGISYQENINKTDATFISLLQQVDFVALSINPNPSLVPQDSPDYRPTENNVIIQNQIVNVISFLKKHTPDCNLYLQSWGTLTGNNLTTNGLFFRGALLMDMLLSLPEEVVMLGVWLNSEQQNEIRDNKKIENNSLSLFFSETTKRPIFHIISMAERLNGILCDRGTDWISTCNGDIKNILLYNSVTINPMLSVQQHLLNDYRKYISLELHLDNPGLWRIKKWIFDQKNGGLYHQYGLHPTRYDRDEETMLYISQRSEPTLTVHDEIVSCEWKTEIMMDINAVCLLEITKIASE